MVSKIFQETSTEKQYILSCLLFLPVLIYYNKWCFNSVLAIHLSTAPILILAKKKNNKQQTNKEKTNKTKGAIECNVRSSSLSDHKTIVKIEARSFLPLFNFRVLSAK